MTKKAFITGITGQDGSYLAELLLRNGRKFKRLYSLITRLMEEESWGKWSRY